MKNIAEIFKKKRTYFKVTSMILVLALMIQTVSVGVTAITESDMFSESENTIATYEELLPSVVGEVEDNRDQHTKVYELADGSFYEIKSSEPIHENVDGSWEEPENDANEPETVDDALSYCSELAESVKERDLNSGVATLSTDIYEENYDDPSYIVVNSTGTQSTRLTNTKILLVSLPSTVYGKSSANQVTMSYQLCIDCQNPTTGNLNAYAVTEAWSKNSENAKVGISYEERVLDCIQVVTGVPEIYTMDISDIYIRWEKGYRENYGIMIKTLDSAKATIGGVYSVRQYKEVESYDSDFTYHTVDMGRAGNVYINDFTNTVLLVRKELGLDGNIMPVELYRYFDFSKTYATTNPSGEASKWNYESRLKKVTDKIYTWDVFDGSTMTFVATNETDVFIDANGENYILDLTNATSSSNYTGGIITSPENTVYALGRAGKVVSITDVNNNSINITYNSSITQSYITQISDGLNRKYVFNNREVGYTHSDGEDSTINTLASIEIKDANGNTIEIDGEKAIIEYSYIILPNNHIALSQVAYPDDKTVSYEYNEFGYLTKIVDIDGRELNICYDAKIPQYTLTDSGINVTEQDFNQYPCVASYTELVKNIDDDPSAEDYSEYLLKSSLEIGRYNNCKRVFINHAFETETIQYSDSLKILYYEDSSGERYYTDYAKDEYGNEYLSQIITPEDKGTVIRNPSFETGTTSFWTLLNSSFMVLGGSLDNTGSYIARINGTTNYDEAACQIYEINGEAEDIYVVGGQARTYSPITTDSRIFGIEVYKCVYNEDDDEYAATDELLYRLSFDPTLEYETQQRLGAFQLSEDVGAVQFRFVYSKQTGYAEFDNAVLYQSDSEHVSFPTMSGSGTEEVATVSNLDENDSLDTLTEYNDKGLITSEIVSDGSKAMVSKYEYDDSYYLSSYTDYNNIKTDFNYNAKTGMLESDSVLNTEVVYSYNSVGALKEVYKAVEGATSDTSKIKSTYSYSNDRIESVSHNGMKYTFTYNSFGNVKKVDVEQLDSQATKSPLIDYNYSNDYKQILNSIKYANGNILSYQYNDDGNVTAIYYSESENDTPVLIYQYEYNNSGEISRIADFYSRRLITYSNNGYEVKEIIDGVSEISEFPVIYSVTVDESGKETVKLFDLNYTKTENEGLYNESTKETSYSTEYSMVIADSSANINSSSISDYFGRVKSSVIAYETNDDSAIHTILNTVTYKDYDATVNGSTIAATTNLIDSFKTEVKNKTLSENNEETSTTINSFTSHYTYDEAGRITKIEYTQGENASKILAYYYEYDNYGQISKEVNALKNEITKYSYDLGGNITAKSLYTGTGDFDSSDISGSIETLEALTPTITTFGYNSSATSEQFSFSDLLTSYNNNAINYDRTGNPLVYYNADGDEYYDMEWNGKLLGAITSSDGDVRYEYSYDNNGLRTQKTAYKINSSSTEKTQVIKYIWDDETVVGYEIEIYNEDEPVSFTVKILYDEYDSPIGVYYYSEEPTADEGEGTTESLGMATSDILWFIKDGQGNVHGIYSETSDYTIGCSYDSYGLLDLDISGRFLEEMKERILNADSVLAASVLTFVLALTAAMVTAYTLEIGQNAYRGYIMDLETGMYYCQGRYYSPHYGRFINMDDPAQLTLNMEEPLNANLYAYCYNDPINQIDPNGKSSYSLTGVGLQAEMSASLLSFAGEVGIELIYVWSKNALYAYYYYGGGAGVGYTNRAISYFKSSLSRMAINSSVSLKNLANLFRLNWSITLGFFAAFTDKSFSWPNSYSGIAKSNSASFGQWKGYAAKSSGCKTYGICYSLVGNSGFAFSETTAQYKRITFNAPAIKSYLSFNKNNIKKAVD